MALASGIPASVWAAEGEQAIVTAIELLKPKKQQHNEDGEEPQMSG